jgi:hypothetical protein
MKKLINVDPSKFNTYDEFYAEYVRVKGIENVRDCMYAASNPQLKKSKWIIEKIENHIKRFSSTETIEKWLHRTATDEMLASLFAKQPQNQNTSETTQKMFNESRGISIEKLPNSKLKIDGFKKTIDYIINGNKQWLTVGKVTNSGGGHQDNVVDEIRDTLIVASKNHFDMNFIFLLDGNRWNKETMSELKEFESERIIISTSDNLSKCYL